MKHRLTFDIVIGLLKERQSALANELRQTNGDQVTLEAKRQVDRAIACLNLCETYQIHPDAEVIVLPSPREAFGEFLVMDVNEMGEVPRPVLQDGEPISLGIGDVVVRQSHPFKFSRKA